MSWGRVELSLWHALVPFFPSAEPHRSGHIARLLKGEDALGRAHTRLHRPSHPAQPPDARTRLHCQRRHGKDGHSHSALCTKQQMTVYLPKASPAANSQAGGVLEQS